MRRLATSGRDFVTLLSIRSRFMLEAMMRIAWLFIGVSLLALVSARDALACSCPSSGPPCQNAFQVDAVFAGTVRRISALPEDGPPLRSGEMRIPRTLRVEFDSALPCRGIQASSVCALSPCRSRSSRVRRPRSKCASAAERPRKSLIGPTTLFVRGVVRDGSLPLRRQCPGHGRCRLAFPCVERCCFCGVASDWPTNRRRSLSPMTCSRVR